MMHPVLTLDDHRRRLVTICTELDLLEDAIEDKRLARIDAARQAVHSGMSVTEAAHLLGLGRSRLSELIWRRPEDGP